MTDTAESAAAQLGTRDRKNIRNDDDTEIRFAVSDHLGDRFSRGFGDLVPQCLLDSQADEYAFKVERARALLEIGDRAGLQQRALECLDRADIGLGRAPLHRDPDARLHHIGPRLGEELTGLDQIVGLEIDQHRQIERLTRLDPPLHDGGHAGHHNGLVAARLFELRAEVGHDHFSRARAEDLELGRMSGAGLRSDERQAGGKRDAAHRHASCPAHSDLLAVRPRQDKPI